MRRLLACAPLLVAACAEPPSLRLALEVRAAEVESVGILVVRENRATPIIDCRVAGDGQLVGRCPFEEPGATWDPGTPLVFVLYGELNQPLEVRAEGIDGASRVVTSTRALVSLPDVGRAERTLVLAARTEVRKRCGLTLEEPSMNVRDRTGVVPVDVDGDGRLELAVGTPRRLSLVRWAADERGCSLVQTATIAGDCNMRGGSLVAGELDATQPGVEVAAVCFQRSNTKRLRLEAWTLDATGQAVSDDYVNLPFVPAANQVTRAVAADLDGDGVLELAAVALTSSASPQLSVVSWRVGAPMPTRVAVPAQLPNVTSAVTIAPLVVSSSRGDHDALVIGGYRNGTHLVDIDGVHTLDPTNLVPPAAAYSGAVYERPGALPRALYVRDLADGAVLLEYAVEANARATPRKFAALQSTMGSASVAVAVGDVDGAGDSSAVVAADGFVHVFSLTSSTSSRRFSIGEAVYGAHGVLLADIDAGPGAEILVWPINTGRVYAFTAAGTAVPGFPVDLGVPGPAETRLVAADLDRDGALELVSITGGQLNAVSLGPLTHHVEATPWPEPYHDGSASARLSGQRDPRVP